MNSVFPLPERDELLQRIVAPAGICLTMCQAVEGYPAASVSAIERLLQWVDSLIDSQPSPEKFSPPASGVLDPASLWVMARVVEKAGRPEDVLDLLQRPQLATADQETETYRLLYVARMYFAMRRWEQCAWVLRRAISFTESTALLRKAANLADKVLAGSKMEFPSKCRLALVGDVTFTDYLSPLKAFAFANQIALKLHFGEYGQHFQELLSPRSPLAAFSPTIVAICLSWHALGLAEEEAEPEAVIARVVASCRDMWRLAHERGAVMVLQHNFEVPETSAYGHLSMALPGGRARLLHSINLALQSAAHEVGRVTVLDVDHLAGVLGKRNWTDDRLWVAAKHYPSAAGATLLARHQMALIRAVHGAPAKCLVLDLDNTLWGGVIGEDGLQGIRLGGAAEGEAFVAFQQYVKSLAGRGIILAVCSKNDEADARAPFLQHPDMVLKLEDIAVFIANWNPKHENLRHIANQLNIGVDSLVLVDDNPAERMSVRALLPQVEVLEIGSDPVQYGNLISRSLVFEALALTHEDRLRQTSYRAAAASAGLQQSAGSLDDYLAGLGMRLSLFPVDDMTLPRAAQLIGKTNQFNLTTSRMNENEVRAYMSAGGFALLARLADNYGDHGITGVMLAKVSGEALCIDEWLLSCRILGRRVEEAMFTAAWNHAHQLGIKEIRATYRRTAKNSQVADLCERLGMSLVEENDALKLYRASVAAPRSMPESFLSIEQPEHAAGGVVMVLR